MRYIVQRPFVSEKHKHYRLNEFITEYDFYSLTSDEQKNISLLPDQEENRIESTSSKPEDDSFTIGFGAGIDDSPSFGSFDTGIDTGDSGTSFGGGDFGGSGSGGNW